MPESAFHFFFEFAGYSYDPKTQTPQQGRRQCAKALARAEERARRRGIRFEWRQDELTSREFSDARPFYPLWACLAYDPQGRMVAALGGVDFGRNREPWGDPYRRVVEAELAAEWTA